MHLTRATGPLPDPLFDVVRRRHPDVDIVLLPPDDPPVEALLDQSEDQPEPLVDDSTVADERQRITRLAVSLWRGAGIRGLDEPEAGPDAVLVPGPAPGTVQPRVRVVQHDPDGQMLLVRLEAELVDRGWRVGRIPGPVERVLAWGERAFVASSYAPEFGTLIVELTSVPLPVGAERARSLVEGP